MSVKPKGLNGGAFGTALDGDGRTDPSARVELSMRLGMPTDWAWVRQVHGATVVEAAGAGALGDADALYTVDPAVTLAVATADCFPVVVEGDGGVGIAHIGWRGAVAGVLDRLLEAMQDAGVSIDRAALGPGIRACCFEVGPEVAERFPDHRGTTSWGTVSVDLPAFIASRVPDVALLDSNVCTRTDERFHSWRRNATQHRQVSVAWLSG